MTVFEENIVVTVLAKLVPLFFKCSCAFSFLTRSLIDRCQIVTDTCKNNVSKFVWKPFKSPLSLRKWKCFGEASLFNLHHLYFNYHLLAQKLFSLWKILPYLQALNHSGSFGKSFVKLKKKCYLPAKGRSVWWKTVTSVLKMLPSAYGLGQYFQDLGHSFSPYGPPSRQITYIYWQEKSTLLTNENKTLDESV